MSQFCQQHVKATSQRWWIIKPIWNECHHFLAHLHRSHLRYSVLAKGAQWTALFEAECGLGGEGGPGKPHTGDEWLHWSITVYFSPIIQVGMPTSKPGSFLRGIPLLLGHANEQGLLQAPTPDWGVQRHCQRRAMGITYQGMASNWTKLSLSNLLWLYSLASSGMAALPLFHGHVARFLAGPRLEAILWLRKEEKRDLVFTKE